VSDDVELSLHVGPGDGTSERLLLIGRPVSGRVRIREWDNTNWGSAAHERELSTAELYASLLDAARRRSAMSVELYQVKLWLDGVAV
jgi:hypothetical protein